MGCCSPPIMQDDFILHGLHSGHPHPPGCKSRPPTLLIGGADAVALRRAVEAWRADAYAASDLAFVGAAALVANPGTYDGDVRVEAPAEAFALGTPPKLLMPGVPEVGAADAGAPRYFRVSLEKRNPLTFELTPTTGDPDLYISRQLPHPSLGAARAEVARLREQLGKKCLMRLRYDNLERCAELTLPSSAFFGKPQAYAMKRYTYFMCFECKEPYYGGEAVCGAAAGEFKPEELICGQCQPLMGGATECEKHGRDYLEYKCRFCCSVRHYLCCSRTIPALLACVCAAAPGRHVPVLYLTCLLLCFSVAPAQVAVWFCFGTTHFCDKCHSQPGRMCDCAHDDLPKCPAGPLMAQLEGDCPLGCKHPPSGEEFCLGCSICREAQTF